MFAPIVALSLLPLLLASPIGAPAKRQQDVYSQIVSERNGLCLSVNTITPAEYSNGLAVITVPCAQAVWWDIHPGSGSILVSGTSWALDAGETPGNNGALKIWNSYPGLYQQTWYYTDDNRIAITGGDQCLDEGDNGNLQTYQCTTGNTNQIFNTTSAVFSSSSCPIQTQTISVTSWSTGPEATTSESGPEVTVTTSISGPITVISSSGGAEATYTIV